MVWNHLPIGKMLLFWGRGFPKTHPPSNWRFIPKQPSGWDDSMTGGFAWHVRGEAQGPEIRKNAGWRCLKLLELVFWIAGASLIYQVDIASISLVGMTISCLAFLLLGGVGSVQSIHQHVAHFRLWFFISSNILAKEKTCIYSILCNTFGTNLLKLCRLLRCKEPTSVDVRKLETEETSSLLTSLKCDPTVT